MARAHGWLFLLAPALFAACGSTGGTEAAGAADASAADAEAAIAAGLVQVAPRTAEHDGQRSLELALENRGDSAVRGECAAEWLDRALAPLDGTSSWQRFDLDPGEKLDLRFAPMPAGARSWRLRFRG